MKKKIFKTLSLLLISASFATAVPAHASTSTITVQSSADQILNVAVYKHYTQYTSIPYRIYYTKTENGYNYGGYLYETNIQQTANGQYEVLFVGTISR